jgi:hypothetical protein
MPLAIRRAIKSFVHQRSGPLSFETQRAKKCLLSIEAPGAWTCLLSISEAVYAPSAQRSYFSS